MSTSSGPERDVQAGVQRSRRRPKSLQRERSALIRTQAIQNGAARVLERLACGAPLQEVLHLLVESIQRVAPEMLGSILLLDQESRRLQHGAAPDLPDFYNEAVDGLEIGPAVGSCGTCAHTGERIIVEDVRTHPYWTDFRELADRAGLRACWSHPITSASGAILGTFAMYYREPRRPHPSDLELITFAAHLAGIAIEHAQTQNALRASEHRYRALVQSAPVCIHEINLGGRLVSINPAGLRLLGARSADEVVGRPFLQTCVAEGARERVAASLERVRQGSTVELEFTRDVEGTPRVFSSCLAPLYDASGNVVKIMGVAQDITERTETEQRQTLLVRELDHRVKNNLAAVLSIAEQTAVTSTSLDEFDAAFRGRIRSMAVAHEILARGNWQGAELHEMLARIAEPYRRGQPERITLTGPIVTLPAKVAPAICMALHELLVNAAKYGALSGTAGRVEVSWTRASVEGTDHLELSWVERGGPPVAPPARRGRGTELIERMISHQLRGRAALRFPPSGVTCRISVPLSAPRQTPVEGAAP